MFTKGIKFRIFTLSSNEMIIPSTEPDWQWWKMFIIQLNLLNVKILNCSNFDIPNLVLFYFTNTLGDLKVTQTSLSLQGFHPSLFHCLLPPPVVALLNYLVLVGFCQDFLDLLVCYRTSIDWWYSSILTHQRHVLEKFLESSAAFIIQVFLSVCFSSHFCWFVGGRARIWDLF